MIDSGMEFLSNVIITNYRLEFIMTDTIERFLRYVKIDTQSMDDCDMIPSTEKQHNLAKLLASELNEMGASDIYYDENHCYVYATIPASTGYEHAKTLGFIAHLDTSPEVSGENVSPRIITEYNGEDIELNDNPRIIMETKEFQELLELKGQDLIVTDGTTLLGADDKAGVAEIMAMTKYLLSHPECEHGKIRIAFTPDEEVGCGTDYFDLKLFDADYAYTVDGGALGEVEYENFNAASGKLFIAGRSVHPGSAKDKMINAILVAQEFNTLLPDEKPVNTEGYEGFYHLCNIDGCVESAECHYIIRDHDKAKFEERKQIFANCANKLNEKYGEGTVTATLTDSYYNMSEIIKDHMHLIDNACSLLKELGVEPQVVPIRGGTDGARLSFEGLPCPNLCTGGANYHSRFEYACVQSMNTVTELLIQLAQKYKDM